MVFRSTLSDFDPGLVDHLLRQLFSSEYVEFNAGNHSSLWIAYVEILEDKSYNFEKLNIVFLEKFIAHLTDFCKERHSLNTTICTRNVSTKTVEGIKSFGSQI